MTEEPLGARTRSCPARAARGLPFTRRQALENARFLKVLAETGNARLAAREVRRAHSTMFERRSGNAAFAQNWEAAVAAAHARFHLAGGKRGPEACPEPSRRRERARRDLGDKEGVQTAPGNSHPFDGRRLRTRGGEAVVVRTRSGKLQLRPAHPGKLTKAAEQAFLLALSATANIRLSAAAAGASARAFYRRREENPAFAREMRLALKMGFERLELAALSARLAGSHEDDHWRHCDPPPLPPMTFGQALQLLFLHDKSVNQSWEQPHRRRRRGESDAIYVERLRAMWAAEKNREAEDAALRRAARYESIGDWLHEDEMFAPRLPPLHLVTGWSRADPKKIPHNPDLALFGGWRIGDMKRKLSHRSGTSMGARRKLPGG